MYDKLYEKFKELGIYVPRELTRTLSIGAAAWILKAEKGQEEQILRFLLNRSCSIIIKLRNVAKDVPETEE